jgi:hypothetical protein
VFSYAFIAFDLRRKRRLINPKKLLLCHPERELLFCGALTDSASLGAARDDIHLDLG